MISISCVSICIYIINNWKKLFIDNVNFFLTILTILVKLTRHKQHLVQKNELKRTCKHNIQNKFYIIYLVKR